MLSNEYAKRVEFLCARIANNSPVEFADMAWLQRLANHSTGVREKLRKARRQSTLSKKDSLDSLDEFCDDMNIGDPDPQNHLTSHSSVDDIANWFKRDPSSDWRTRD